ncbi:MAG: alpha/beta hydrolase [Gemmatimonadota bacterium]
MNALDEQFDLRRRHPTARVYQWANALESRAATYALPHDFDIAYGDSPGQRLDVFPAEGDGAPVFVFIHGGYFRALDKSGYRYIARMTTRLGMTCVLVNYDLVPSVRVGDVVDQVQRAVHWIGQHVSRWRGDARRVTLCGHSVGAFLVAKVLEQDGLDRDVGVERAMLLSGLFDLAPMRASYLNDVLRLTPADVSDLSPIGRPLRSSPPLLIAVGEEETEEFVRQSRAYAAKLDGDGVRHEHWVMPGIHHYSMARMLGRLRNPLTDWLRA